MRYLRTVWLFVSGVLGLLHVPDCCQFSEWWYDVHDYHLNKGGDGTPSHFYTYQCWNCGKEFDI